MRMDYMGENGRSVYYLPPIILYHKKLKKSRWGNGARFCNDFRFDF